MEVRRVAGSSSMGVEDLGVLAPLRRLGVMVWTVANLVARALRDGLQGLWKPLFCCGCCGRVLLLTILESFEAAGLTYFWH